MNEEIKTKRVIAPEHVIQVLSDVVRTKHNGMSVHNMLPEYLRKCVGEILGHEL